MFTKHFSIQKHIAIGVMVAAMFFGMTMSVAHAQTPTVSELQTLITTLTEQINALKSGGGTGTSVAKPASTTNGGTCVSPFTRPLQFGSSDATTGGDVTRLQNYLATTGHFTYGKPTGFYGTATVDAVKRWQAERGIVSSGTPSTTGYGVVGPTTRAKIFADCTSVGETDPTKTSPVLETFTVTADDLRAVVKFSLPNSCGGYVINWGDGNKTTRDAATAGTACTQAIQNVTQARTYRSAGTYTITVETYAGTSLRSSSSKSVTVGASVGTDSCLNNGVSYPEGTKRTSITNTDGSTKTVSDASFVCRSGEWKIEGGLPVATNTFTTSITDLRVVAQFTLPNGCAGYVINWGDGNKTTRDASAAGSACTQAIQNVTQARTYQKAGTYTITVERYSSGTTRIDTNSKVVTVGTPAVTGCMSGGVSYAEGAKLYPSLMVLDAPYQVCRNGVWVSEGGLPRPVDPTPSTACLIGQVSYPEGTTRTGAIQPGGTWLVIADITSVCENGKWVSKNTYPLPPTTTSCTYNGRTYAEGEGYTPAGVADIEYVCRNGKWVNEGGLLPPPTNPLPTCTLKASRTSVTSGTTSRLTWTSTNTGSTMATLTGFATDGVNPRNTAGYRDVKPSVSTTYTLTVKNNAGDTATCSVRVSVSQSSVRGASTTNIEESIKEIIATVEAMIAQLK